MEIRTAPRSEDLVPGRTVIVTDAYGKRPAAARVVRPALGGLVTVKFLEHGFAPSGSVRDVIVSHTRIPAAFEAVGVVIHQCKTESETPR